MTLQRSKIEEIVAIVRKRYLHWMGFSDSDFAKDEVEYKQATIAKATELIGEPEFRRLLDAEAFDEIVERLDTLGKDNNLLWRSAPMSGDLNILYQPALDKPSFCHAMFDLLYGSGPSHERLGRYVSYITTNDLPNKWTFPTYFLFMCHPDTEMFVKPRTMQWVMEFMSKQDAYASTPNAKAYAAIKEMTRQLRDGFQEYGPRDMVDIQGLLWVCASVARESDKGLLAPDRKAEFVRLFQEFAGSYPSTPEGRRHVAAYDEGRKQARENFKAIVGAAERGEDVEEETLLKLLPYGDSPANRERGTWISIAPALTTHVRTKFEGAQWTKPEDWPHVAEAILRFVRRCSDDPDQLSAACAEFSELPYSKGFQTGMLTPILNALRPDDFLLVNNKSRRVINYFANTSHSQKLTDYPATNATGHDLIAELAEEMRQQHGAPGIRDTDLFDMFSHWLVAVKGYEFPDARYWKIAPGENAWNWDECREGGFIAIGWDELGDVSGLSRSEFNARRDALVSKHDDWTKMGADQVWRFAHIKEGDRIVANRGTTEVLGIGRVVGSYYFVEGQRHGHQLPVEWDDDVTLRQVDEYGWRRTLVELDREKFGAICNASPLRIRTDLAKPFSTIFKDKQEAEWAFDLLQETFERLGIESPDDPRFALTLRYYGRVLRFTFGSWLVLGFYGSSHRRDRVDMTLMVDLVDIDSRFERSEPFQDTDVGPVCIYKLPVELVRPLEGGLREAYEATLDYIANRFQDWRQSSVRRFNQPEIAAAVFDSAKRDELFATGLSIEIEEEDSDQGQTEEGYFTERTFELLAQLHEDPTRDFYLKHKEAFKEHVEEPFQQLFRSVADQLLPPIAERMETERRIFARIIKNDFGRGGAWDFYWGAFYSKGGKRTEDAQLFLSINRDRLEFGFYIGEYGSAQRNRFLRNCQENYEVLIRPLRDGLPGGALFFGEREDFVGGPEGFDTSKPRPSFEDWLRDPSEAGIRAAVFLPKEEVLQRSEAQLTQEIVDVCQGLFPLVLLATLDDPMPAIGDYLGLEEPLEINPEYLLSQCAKDTGFDKALLERWVRAIERKRQAIVYGPPGTGKTYIAEHLARHLIGGGDGFWEVVQFHPAYAYEDFVQGIRPKRKADGQLDYPIVPGRFLEFCEKAGECKGRCVLIIDEINRANLARVFGELMYLLEYRDREVPLASGGFLRIPGNVRIIGTMNTADRSIALVDHALRRRFAFLPLYPNYDILRRYHQSTGFDVEPLISVLQKLNRQIGDRHYEVGITFFLRDDLAEQIDDIWRMEIEPYLEEYFFDQWDKVDAFRWERVVKEILP